jgi:hypothetical protein
MSGIETIERAGHWIQQEHPVRLGKLLLKFMKEIDGRTSLAVMSEIPNEIEAA